MRNLTPEQKDELELEFAIKELFGDIYDLLRGTILYDDESKDTTEFCFTCNDYRGKLTRKHYKEAKKNWRKALLNKHIDLNGDNNTITIGQKNPMIIKLIIN